MRLDSTRAHAELGWKPPLTLQEGIELTAKWFCPYRDGEDARAATLAQIDSRRRGPR